MKLGRVHRINEQPFQVLRNPALLGNMTTLFKTCFDQKIMTNVSLNQLLHPLLPDFMYIWNLLIQYQLQSCTKNGQEWKLAECVELG